MLFSVDLFRFFTAFLHILGCIQRVGRCFRDLDRCNFLAIFKYRSGYRKIKPIYLRIPNPTFEKMAKYRDVTKAGRLDNVFAVLIYGESAKNCSFIFS